MQPDIVATVLARDVFCARCGIVNGPRSAIHHRRLRSQGGRDTPANLLALHHGCHNIGPHSVHQNPALAYEMGWLVPSWAEPSEYALTLPTGATVLLAEDGTHTQLTGETNGW
jgi:hypothetical protein